MNARAILSVEKNGEPLNDIPFESEISAGRGEGCVLRLDDRAISRQHAVFRALDSGVQVERKSEFAPLAVNGIEVTSAILKEGDVVSMGPFSVKLKSAQKSHEESQVEAQQPSSNLKLEGQSESLNVMPPLGTSPLTVDLPVGGTPLAPIELPPAQKEDVTAPSVDASMLSLQLASTQNNLVELPPQNVSEGNVAGEIAIETPIPDSSLSLQSTNSQQAEAQQDLNFSEGALDVVETENPQNSLNSLSLQSDSVVVADDAPTKVLSLGSVGMKLTLAPGAANVEDFELTKDSIFIGRDKSCEIILADKKSSRKHAQIRQVGMNFFVQDLGSANGTYVNGTRINSDQELMSDDVIRIGGTEILFQAVSSDYKVKEKSFLKVSEQQTSSLDADRMSAPSSSTYTPALQFEDNPIMAAPVPPVVLNSNPQGGAQTQPNADLGIPGLQASNKKQSLAEKFKALPRGRKAIWIIIALGFAYFAFFDDESEQVNKTVQRAKKPNGGMVVNNDTPTVQAGASGVPQAVASAVPNAAAEYEKLTQQQKEFVDLQFQKGFEKYKSNDYDAALFELQKIFALVSDYKNSREIERYALEGKRRLEARKDEKKKEEESQKLKLRVAELLQEAAEKMNAKNYTGASELFGPILAIDPENPQVPVWKKEMEDFEIAKRAEEEKKRNREKLVAQAWDKYKEGAQLKRKGKCFPAMAVFKEVASLPSPDRKPAFAAQSAITECREKIRSEVEPKLSEAKQFEESNEYMKAYTAYRSIASIDPSMKEGFRGADRAQKVLHERAKVAYTEAVLAESYSDFATAKKKYKEILASTPNDDLYHERAERKLARFIGKTFEDEPGTPQQ